MPEMIPEIKPDTLPGTLPDAAKDIMQLLERWAEHTRKDQKDLVLQGHAPDTVFYDVLGPLDYRGTAAYRASWDDWQPQTTGEPVFALQDINVTAGGDTGFAFGLIRCGGTMPDGRTFCDTVRATFCLRKTGHSWRIVHQHISRPQG